MLLLLLRLKGVRCCCMLVQVPQLFEDLRHLLCFLLVGLRLAFVILLVLPTVILRLRLGLLLLLLRQLL
jgi:hypothetical protein